MPRVLHLGYHYVSDAAEPGLTCTPGRLIRQIQTLKDGGYTFLTCGEVVERLQSGKVLPEKYATLSFDDGLKSQFLEAYRILKKFGISATFFYITCALRNELPPVIGFQILIQELGVERLIKDILPLVFKGTPYADLLDPDIYKTTGVKQAEPEAMRRIKWIFNYFPGQEFKKDLIRQMFTDYLGNQAQNKFVSEWFMNTDDLKELQSNGMEIASHSDSHPVLTTSGKKEIAQEAATSQRILQEVLGREIATFSWPFGGKYSIETKKIILQTYSSAWNFFPTKTKIVMDNYSDLADIARIDQQCL